jgi:uncharacterized protein (DUF1697 family)
MNELRRLYESLGLGQVQTYLQSGNVVFATRATDLRRLARRLEDAIEQTFGFRPAVILRTPSELRATIASNPFAKRDGINPAKLLVTFLAGDPGEEARKQVLAIKTDPEELRIVGRELFIYFPNGMGRSELSPAGIEKILRSPGTGRNWNTVTKLLEIAERLEHGS